MVEVLKPLQGLPNDKSQNDEYVFFHSGSTPTYRKVTKSTTQITTIPTIDITSIDSPDPSVRNALAQELYEACVSCGFFYLKGHGMSDELLAETFDLLERFFALDLESKMDAHVQKNPAIRGYEPMGETKMDPRTKLDFKESYTIGDCPLEPEQKYTEKTGKAPPGDLKRPQNIWPSAAPWYRDGLYRYYNEVLPVSLKLVRLLALSLKLDEDKFLGDFFNFPITGMRALHYPPVPPEDKEKDELNIGLGAHSDFSYLTLVLQTPSLDALEVLTPAGQWIQVPAIPNTLVCNVGQYLERQTNGRFLAAVHRVRNKTGDERYSLPFFLTMDPDAQVSILVEDKEEKKFEDFNVGDLYIKKVLPARVKHPTSIKYREVPEEEWKYEFLLE
ncbi:2og-Fe oxygenase family protein [Leptodontidium sp. MPI-SDFR-AT-0119]|nr:2og-Fe oxygenase family protein [Leptodontidium sp. MPI-SDFR-AT-0119]